MVENPVELDVDRARELMEMSREAFGRWVDVGHYSEYDVLVIWSHAQCLAAKLREEKAKMVTRYLDVEEFYRDEDDLAARVAALEDDDKATLVYGDKTIAVKQEYPSVIDGGGDIPVDQPSNGLETKIRLIERRLDALEAAERQRKLTEDCSAPLGGFKDA